MSLGTRLVRASIWQASCKGSSITCKEHTCTCTWTHTHAYTHSRMHTHMHTHSHTHTQVYSLTLRAAGVPTQVVSDYKPFLSNMLGLVRGNIYYNLMNWYRCLSCIPVGDTAKYMETMMGVKQVRLSLRLIHYCQC